MSDKVPQPTAVLIERLRRVAKWFDAFDCNVPVVTEAMKARANTCLQAAGRLEELEAKHAEAESYVTHLEEHGNL